MPRTPSPEREAEYTRLAALTEAIWSVLRTEMGPEFREYSIEAEATRVREIAGFSAALEGLKQGLNDALEMVQGASPDSVQIINRKLAQLGSPPVAVLLAHRHGRVKKLLRQKTISTETEYYLLKESVVNVDSGLSATDRDLAQRLLNEYESRLAG